MRIVQVINSLATGGAENLVKAFYRRFLKRGEKSTVVSLVGDSSGWIEEGVYCLGLTSPYDPRVLLRLVESEPETGLSSADIVHVHLFPAQMGICLLSHLTFLEGHLVTTEHNTHNRRRGTILGRFH